MRHSRRLRPRAANALDRGAGRAGRGPALEALTAAELAARLGVELKTSGGSR